jgi:hypothetical protein
VTDKEFVDLLLNLEFLPGDDISRARTLYEQAAQSQALSWAEPPTEVALLGLGAIEGNELASSAGNTSEQSPSNNLLRQSLFPFKSSQIHLAWMVFIHHRHLMNWLHEDGFACRGEDYQFLET